MPSTDTQSKYGEMKGDYEGTLPVKQSGRFPTVWLVFCHIIASFMLLCGVGVLCGAPVGIALSSYGPNLSFAMSICIILISLAAGICAPISVVFASHKTVIGWTITHACLFTLNLIFVIVQVTATNSIIMVSLLAAPMCAFQLIFLCVYGPLISIKNLQRPPKCCACCA